MPLEQRKQSGCQYFMETAKPILLELNNHIFVDRRINVRIIYSRGNSTLTI